MYEAIFLQNPDNIENKDAKGYVELNLLSDIVADYEERNYLQVSKVNK